MSYLQIDLLASRKNGIQLSNAFFLIVQFKFSLDFFKEFKNAFKWVLFLENLARRGSGHRKF